LVAAIWRRWWLIGALVGVGGIVVGVHDLRHREDPTVLKFLLKVKDGAGGSYWSGECGACDMGWQVPYYAESVGRPRCPSQGWL
jgi:hypothetical protein